MTDNTTIPALEELHGQIEALRRAQTRLRLLVCVSVLAVVVVGAGKRPEDIVARSLRIVDKHGRAMVMLMSDPDGGFIAVTDTTGEPMAMMGCSGDRPGGAFTVMSDPKTIAGAFRTDRLGQGEFSLRARNNARVILGFEGGMPVVWAADSTGKTVEKGR